VGLLGRWVDLDGMRISYADRGDANGVPVVLLPGFGDSWRSFEPLVSQLPRWVRSLALTPRGHGDSDHPPSGYRLLDYAGDVSDFIDALDLEGVILVGHSSSCFVIQRFALDHPEQTRGLAFIASPLTLRGHPALLDLWRSAIAGLEDPIDPEFVREFQRGATGTVSPAFMEAAVAETMKVPAVVWRETFRDLLEEDLSGELGKITSPALLLWGNRDPIATREDQAAIAAAIPDARLAVLEGCGHSPHWEDPVRVASELAAFADGLSARIEKPGTK
jgi:non-heme chloroperoxidase